MRPSVVRGTSLRASYLVYIHMYNYYCIIIIMVFYNNCDDDNPEATFCT